MIRNVMITVFQKIKKFQQRTNIRMLLEYPSDNSVTEHENL